MKKWRWLILILTGSAFVWWLPELVESRLRPRSLPNGLAWQVQFNAAANEQDNPSHVTVDGDGQVLLTGTSFTGRSQGSWLVKHDGNTGRELWRWTADFALQSVPVADSNGNIYLAGSEARGYRPGPLAPPFSGPDTDFAVCKVAGKNGAVEWKSTFDGGLRDTDWAEELGLK
ncbi:MAG: hypothetical protein M3463_06610 [Verrucomicrobiota bacterium]|nr:hypothetical protein [Verrucomicrobiota bacterium]